MRNVLTLLLLLALLPATLAAQTGRPPRNTPIVFHNVTVVGLTGAPSEPGMTVVITGGRVSAVGKTGKVPAPEGAAVVDATGKFLIPGLWDMHVHLSETKTPFPLFIANGVLGVRHMGGNLKRVYEYRESARRGELLAPRIVACGPVVSGEDGEDVVGATTAAEGRRAVSLNEGRGADFIKVYDGVSRDAYLALAAEAKRRRVPFAGHVPVAVTSFEAADAGQSTIEHLGNILRSSSGLPAPEIERRVDALVRPSGEPGDFSHIPARIAERTKIELAHGRAGRLRLPGFHRARRTGPVRAGRAHAARSAARRDRQPGGAPRSGEDARERGGGEDGGPGPARSRPVSKHRQHEKDRGRRARR